jgi:5-methylcytosine-specific restriction endonuclease McrA
MTRLDSNTEGFVQYGIAFDLAERVAGAGLTVTKARALSQQDMVRQFSLTKDEAKVVKEAVQRQPVDKETLYTLLESSNYTCNICKGMKGTSYIVHHIRPYAKTQDNDYRNLIILCPNDHDRAHSSGLTMGLSIEELQRAKIKWEALVEKANAVKAAQTVEVNGSAIDYMNVRRIEELCLQVFGKIPETRTTASLRANGIIDAHSNFQQKFVPEKLSSGRYLFDYINSGEALHYRDLVARIAERVKFEDLSAAVDSGKKKVAAMEGSYAFFIGGVYSKRPEMPITADTPSVVMH